MMSLGDTFTFVKPQRWKGKHPAFSPLTCPDGTCSECLRQKLTHTPPGTKEVIPSWIRPDGEKCLVILGSRGR